jgi:hypothetical protein
VTRRLAEELRTEYGLDDEFKKDLQAAFERLDRGAAPPPPAVDDRDETIKRLNTLVNKQADIHARAQAEVDRLEAENVRLLERAERAEEDLDDARRRIRSFESLARVKVAETA